MHILVDILHPAHLNFYKRAISLLKQQNHRLTVLVRERGNLVEFARRELDVPIRVVGKHYRNRLGKIYGLVHRVVYLVVEGLRNPYDVTTSHGGFYAAIAARLTRKKSVIFYDNFEYRLLFNLCRWFASTFIVPSCLEVKAKNIRTFCGYKELAYLNCFTPSEEILGEYGVQKKQYVFIRHIAHISLDYWKQDHETVLESILEYLLERNYMVVASVEQRAAPVPCLSGSDLVRIMRRPTSAMHSLMYHARCVISSGDTVAREAALLGVPAMYIGTRNMRINRELIRLGRLAWTSKKDAIPVLEKLLQKENRPLSVQQDWEDTTDVILHHLGCSQRFDPVAV